MITQMGNGKAGQLSMGGGDAFVSSAMFGLFVALVGDRSSHGGTIINSNQDGTVKAHGVAVVVEGAQHSCPVPGHGTTTITARTTKSLINGKKIVTYGATAGCGAIILPPKRKVTVEA